MRWRVRRSVVVAVVIGVHTLSPGMSRTRYHDFRLWAYFGQPLRPSPLAAPFGCRACRGGRGLKTAVVTIVSAVRGISDHENQSGE